MKYIQSRFTYILTGVVVTVAIIVGCSDTIKTSNFEPANTEELTQNAEFKSIVGDIEKMNAPIVKRIESMPMEKLGEFSNKIFSYIDTSGSRPKLTVTPEKFLKEIGYENPQQYKERWQSIREKAKKLQNATPDLKKGVIKKAANQILNKNNPKNSDATVLGEPCTEEYVDCMEEKTVDLYTGSLGCIFAGIYATFPVGLACQAVNVANYELQKYLCIQGYWDCTGCTNHCVPDEDDLN